MRKKNPNELNKREKAILKFIEKQIKENGYPPSVREIGKAVGLKSTATVHGYLSSLSSILVCCSYAPPFNSFSVLPFCVSFLM